MTHKREDIDEKYEISLLHGFNSRKDEAFSNVYLYMYDELYFYSYRIFFGTTVLPEDAIHDVFMNIWSNDKYFVSLEHIKSYAYLSIKNNFRNLIAKKGHFDKYESEILCDQSYDDALQIEAQTLSIIDRAMEILPNECGKVLRMLLDGYSAEEVAEKLGKSVNTVYSQKQTAINILKKKLPRSSFAIILSLLHNL